jgi:tetratricopeptide (TPR) repeat protein
MLQGYYGLLACCNQLPGPGLQRIQICLKALEVFPYDAQLLLTMGGYLQGENRLDLAVRAFQTAVETGRVDLETWHLSELAEVAVACYGAALQLQGNSAKAGRILEDSLRRYPRSARLKRLSLEVFIQLGRRDKALEIAETLFSDWPDRALLADVIRGACLARKRQWTAALGSLQSAYLRGCRHPICLRWLAVTLVSQGQAEAALPVLKEWRQAEPQHPELQAYLAAFAEKTDSGTEEEKTPSVKGSGSSPDRQYRLDLAGIFSSPFPPQGSLPHTLPLPGNSLPLRP